MNSLNPVKTSVSPINGVSDSLFVTCASYEDRSVLAARKLSADYKADRAVIFQSVEYRNKGRSPQHFEEIADVLARRSDHKLIEMSFSMQKPTEFLDGFKKLVTEFGEAGLLRAITIDISTFPRRELLVLLRFIDGHPRRGIIRLLYGEPERYATEESNEEERWLTRGVRSVQSVPHFGGIQLPRKSKLLVIILGHEGERTHITLRRHQPDKLILIPQGKEQHHEGLREIAERENKQVISIFGTNSIWDCGLPSRGVVETEQVIKEIYKQHRYTCNMFVAANGTKLQLLGVYLACRSIPEIQITYAVPALYNWQRYSTGSGRLSEMILQPMEPLEQSR